MPDTRWPVRAGAAGLAISVYAVCTVLLARRVATPHARVYTVAAVDTLLATHAGRLPLGQTLQVMGRLTLPSTVLPGQVYALYDPRGDTSLPVVPGAPPALLAALRQAPLLAPVLPALPTHPVLDRLALYQITPIGCHGPSLCPSTWQLVTGGVPLHPVPLRPGTGARHRGDDVRV